MNMREAFHISVEQMLLTGDTNNCFFLCYDAMSWVYAWGATVKQPFVHYLEPFIHFFTFTTHIETGTFRLEKPLLTGSLVLVYFLSNMHPRTWCQISHGAYFLGLQVCVVFLCYRHLSPRFSTKDHSKMSWIYPRHPGFHWQIKRLGWDSLLKM